MMRGENSPGGRQINYVMGRWMTAGGTIKSQQCHMYFLQYSTFASERPQVRTRGRQTSFLPQAPCDVNRVTPLTWLLVISNIKCCNKYNNQAESYREGAGSIIALAPNRCGGAKKSKQCHKYFPQCNTFASERPQVWTWGAKLASFHFHAFHSQCCRMLVQKKAQCPRKTSPKNTKLTQITAKNLR